MLLDAPEFMRKSNNLRKEWKGIVVFNADPLKLGRVKCSILGLFESGDEASLPFIACKNPAGLGGAADSSSFAVPEVGSELTIEFPFEDVYAPFYTGYWQHGLSHQVEFNEDYPNSYGHRDSTGNVMLVNKAKKTAVYTHASGSSIGFSGEGDIVLRSARSIKLESADGQTMTDFDMQTGGMKSTPKEETEQGGQKHAVTANAYREEVKSKLQRIEGTKDVSIDGSEKKQVGGDSASNVAGNVAKVIGGDVSELTAGKTEKTYALGITRSIVLGDVIQEIIAGNYGVDVAAGNISLTTKAGSIELGNLIGNLSIDLVGNPTLKGLMTSIQGLATAEVKAPLVNLGPSPLGNVITTLTSPLVDNITGQPAVGSPFVLA